MRHRGATLFFFGFIVLGRLLPIVGRVVVLGAGLLVLGDVLTLASPSEAAAAVAQSSLEAVPAVAHSFQVQFLLL